MLTREELSELFKEYPGLCYTTGLYCKEDVELVGKLAKFILSGYAKGKLAPMLVNGPSDTLLKCIKGLEVPLGKLGDLQGNLSKYNKSVGIYKAYLNDELVYIGRAIEADNGGFRKRLTDYIRESASARGTNSSSNMFKYKGQLDIKIIPLGGKEAVDATKTVEEILIKHYKPKWNVEFNR